MGHHGRFIDRALLATALAALAILAVAGSAAAKTCTKQVAPPGHAGSTEYFETVPTSCGNASPPGGGSASSGGSIDRLGHGGSGTKALSHLGSAGQAAAALAAATAPAPFGPAAANRRGSSSNASQHQGAGARTGIGAGLPHGGGKTAALPSVSGSPGGAVGSALAGDGGSGLGILLPALLALILMVAVAAGVVRARRPGDPSA